jgi:carbon monoxide dehydrogenase subunit G
MEISGSYTLYAPRAQVWAALLDPDHLREAIPGCERLEWIDGDTYALRVVLGLAALSGTYEATLRLMERREPERFRIAIQSTGAGGLPHGYGGLMLEERGPSTTIVTYAGEALLGGKAATSANAGLFVVRGAARVLINQFFSRLAATLDEEAAPEEAAPEEAAPEEAAPATSAPGVGAWPITGLPEARPLEIAAQGTPEARPLPASAPAAPSPTHAASTQPAARPTVPSSLTAPAALRRLARRAGLTDGSVESEQRAAFGLLGVALGLSLTLVATLAARLGERRRGPKAHRPPRRFLSTSTVAGLLWLSRSGHAA